MKCGTEDIEQKVVGMLNGTTMTTRNGLSGTKQTISILVANYALDCTNYKHITNTDRLPIQLCSNHHL